MERLTLGELFDRVALGTGDGATVVFPASHSRQSHRELHARVGQLAKALIGIGVDAGDHVAVLATNRPEWLQLQLAAAKAGAVLVPLDPATGADELFYLLAQSGASTLFVGERHHDLAPLDALLACCPEIEGSRPGRLASRRLPALKRVAFLGAAERDVVGILPWAEVVRSAAGITDHLLRRRQDGVDPGDAVVVLYTAGTTGRPKGAELSHLNLIENAAAVGECLRLTRRDRLCVPVSLFRGLGCVLGTVTALGRGLTMVVPSETPDAAAALTAVARERCTVMLGEPRLFASALRSPEVLRVDLSSLRTGLVAGAACSPELLPQIVERLHIRDIMVAYGQNEATAVITATRAEDSVDLRATTVGRALPHLEIQIVHPTSGVEVARGVEGELCCRGPSVMRGYHGMPEATAGVLGPNGWLRTGDLAVMDQHGYCIITGRTVPKSS